MHDLYVRTIFIIASPIVTSIVVGMRPCALIRIRSCRASLSTVIRLYKLRSLLKKEEHCCLLQCIKLALNWYCSQVNNFDVIPKNLNT